MASKLLMSIMCCASAPSVSSSITSSSSAAATGSVVDLGVRRRGSAVVLAVRRLVGRLAVGRAHAGEVDAELLGGAQEVVVLLAHLGAGALLGDDVDVERERLHLLEEHLERLGDARLGDVLALDDRLVGLHAADGVVGLDREHLLERVGGAVRLERPHLHLAEALAAELRLAAQRLLGDERVRAGRAGVDLVVDEVEQLQDVHVADRHLRLERLAGAPVEERELAARPLALAGLRVGVHLDAAFVLLLPLHQRGVDVLRPSRRRRRASRRRRGAGRCRRSCLRVGLLVARRSRRRTSPAPRPSRGASRGSGRCSCGSARRAG